MPDVVEPRRALRSGDNLERLISARQLRQLCRSRAALTALTSGWARAAAAGNLYCVAGVLVGRTALVAGLAFLAAGIGLTTLWVALNTRSWDGFEAVVIPPLVVGVAFAAGWACVLGVGLLAKWAWARSWALHTFVAVSAFSGLTLLATVGRVVDGGETPVRHLVAPGSLFTVAVSIVLLLAFAGEPDRS